VEQHETLRPRVHHRGKHGPTLSLESPALRVLGAHKDGAFEAEPLKGLIQRLRAPGVFGHGWTLPFRSSIWVSRSFLTVCERFHTGAISQRTEGANDEDRLDARGYL
jgi:hypothetical protein